MIFISFVRRNQWRILLFLLVMVLTVIATWPLITNLSSSVYGYSGDSFGHIYYLWWWRRSFFEHFSISFLPLQQAPFGAFVPRDPGTIVFLWPSYFLLFLFNEVVVYNLLLLASFLFSAIFAYYFFKQITKSEISSILFSVVFSFSPYHFWQAYNHLDLAMIQYIPLFLWSLILIKKKPSWSKGLLGGVTLALLVLVNFYYGYFGFLTLGLFSAYSILEGLIKKIRIFDFKYYLMAGLVAIVVCLPFVYPTLTAVKQELPQSRRETYDRPLDNLLLLSARPWSYVLPSIDNPLLGRLSLDVYKSIEKLSNDFKTQMPFPNEVTVYLGYFSLGFFTLSLWFCWKRKIEWGLIPLLLFVAGGLFLISMPPFIIIKSVTVYFPTFFLHKIFPMFRAYGRLGIFILPLVSGVAAIGFTYILERLKREGKVILTVSCFLLFLLEFTNIPPFRVTDFSKIPEAYAWLKEQPGDFSIMEYPKNFNLAEGELFQRDHGKKMANWYSTSMYYKMWPAVEDIYMPESYEILSALGVKYAVLHKKLIFDTPNPVDELWWARAYRDPIKYEDLPENTSLIKSFPGEDILEVSADPDLYRLVMITALNSGQKKSEVINNLWNPKKPGKLFVFNLTEEVLKVNLADGKAQKDVTLPPGKLVVKFDPGNYNLKVNILDL